MEEKAIEHMLRHIKQVTEAQCSSIKIARNNVFLIYPRNLFWE